MNIFFACKKQALSYLCMLLFICAVSVGQGVDSIAVLNQIKVSSREYKDSLYYELVKIYRSSDPDQAKAYARHTYSLSKEFNHLTLNVKSCYALGYFYSKDNMLDSAVYFYNKGIAAAHNKLPQRLIYLYNDVGNLYEKFDIYDSALQNYLRSYEIAFELKNYQDQAIAQNNMGTISSRLNNYKEAARFYQTALEIKRANNITDGLDINMINLAFCYNNMSRYDEAESLLQQVVTFCETNSCDKAQQCDVYYGFGYGFFQTKNYEKAITSLLTARALALEQNNLQTYASSGVLLGMCELALSQAALKAETLFLESKRIAIEHNFKRILRDSYEQLSLLYESQNKLSQAIEMNKGFNRVKDSIFNEKLANNLRELQVLAARKESQHIIDEQSVKISRSTTIAYLTGISTLLALGLSVSLYKNMSANKRMKQKLQVEVEQKTVRLQNTVDQLAKVNSKLRDSQSEYESLIYRTSHDIRGPLATLMGLTLLAEREYIDHPDLLPGYLEKIKSTSIKLNDVLSGILLVNTVRSQPIVFETVNVKKLVLGTINKFKHLDVYPLIELSVDIEEDFCIITDRVILELVLENTLRNSFTYISNSNKKHTIRVHAKFSEDKRWVHVKVEDNGVGIEKQFKDQIFELFFVASERHGAGIGLYLSRVALERLGGSILISRIKDPTVFEIRILNKESIS